MGMYRGISEFWRDRSAATAIEYAFVLALISIAAVGGFTYFANEMNNLYDYVNSNFQDATD